MAEYVRVRDLAAMVGLKVRVMFLIVLVFVIAFWYLGTSLQQHSDQPRDHGSEIRYGFSRVRKLLEHETKGVNPNRMGEGCSPNDIAIYQAPTYTVQVLNLCIADGCRIGHIHLSCGWFSSARLINPCLFRRISFDDCLVNDGFPIPNGRSVSFQYANSFHYPLSVSSAVCLDP